MESIVFLLYDLQVANPSEMLHMLKYIKRVKVEKTEIDEKIMANMFNGQVSFKNNISHSKFENILRCFDVHVTE